MMLLITSGAFLIRYIVAYRFDELIQLLISKETNNSYSFNSSKIKVALLDKEIIIKDATLNCIDTSQHPTFYNIKFANLYFSVHSLQEILFNKKLTIDSLAISKPVFHSYNRIKNTEDPNFHFSHISNVLEKALTYLQLKNFSITNGELKMEDSHHSGKIHGEGINLHITNFSQKKDNNKHFLFSDEVELNIKKQTLLLPSGLHEMTFNQLHFSGKNQFFQLDSFAIVSSVDNPDYLYINSHQIYFKSTDLTSIYEKEEITIDSLIIHNPKLVIANKKQTKDTITVIHEATRELISGIKIKYIDINGGSFSLIENQNNKEIYGTDIMNMRLENIEVKKENISVGSIHLDQRNINFMTKDSLFQLNVEEFSFINNEVLLINTSYKPTHFNNHPKKLSFAAPLLKLSNVSIEDLILKRLKARSAELVNPDILITTDAGQKNNINHDKNEKLKRSDLFYKTLNDMHEIIQVDSFQIKKGRVKLQSTGNLPLSMNMHGVSSLILLNRFFMSDSMIDIKRSLPRLHVENIHFTTNKLSLDIANYDFNGSTRYNHAAQFKLKLINNTTINGKDIGWEIFDWDLLEKEDIIQIDHINVGDIDIVKGEKNNNSTSKGLPVIRIDRIDINKLNFSDHPHSPYLLLKVKDICMDEVRSVNHLMTWNNLEGKIDGLSFPINNTTINTGEIIINNYYQHEISHVEIKDSTFNFVIPKLILQNRIHSTDLSSFTLKLINFTNGQFSLLKNGFDVKVSDVSATITDATIVKNIHKKTTFEGSVIMHLNNATVQKEIENNSALNIENLHAIYKNKQFSSKKINAESLINNATIQKGEIKYKNNSTTVKANNIQWHPENHRLQLKDFSVTPNEKMEDRLKKSEYQFDHLELKGESIIFQHLALTPAFRKGGEIKVRKVIFNNIDLHTTKDKRLPLLRSRIKLMPTEMIKKINFPFTADTLFITNSSVTVNEISASTHQKGIIPLIDINATVTNLSNKGENQDSIYLDGSLRLFSTYVHKIQYAESYPDSLSSFRMHLLTSPIHLQEYSTITQPLLSAAIVSGKSDSLHAKWAGNKHAASGTMHFKYENLKIKLLNKKNPGKKGLLLKIENILANAIIKNNNKEKSSIFFARDKNKSVFNYWVKTKLSGVMSSVVNIKNKNNQKKYKKLHNKYNIDVPRSSE